MNKSEIAEKAAREIAKLATGWDYSDVPDLFEEEILKFVERAIAESQAPQPPDKKFPRGTCDVHTGGHSYFALPGSHSPACVNWVAGEPSPPPDNRPIKTLAWEVWQLLGAIWGIHTTHEQARICNYFHDLAEFGETYKQLFPLKLEVEVERAIAESQPQPDIEAISARVHDSWMTEKRAKGFHGPEDICPRTNLLPRERFSCCKKYHPDMIPYSELTEAVKELDRVTVRTVLKAMGELGDGEPT